MQVLKVSPLYVSPGSLYAIANPLYAYVLYEPVTVLVVDRLDDKDTIHVLCGLVDSFAMIISPTVRLLYTVSGFIAVNVSAVFHNFHTARPGM